MFVVIIGGGRLGATLCSCYLGCGGSTGWAGAWYCARSIRYLMPRSCISIRPRAGSYLHNKCVVPGLHIGIQLARCMVPAYHAGPRYAGLLPELVTAAAEYPR